MSGNQPSGSSRLFYLSGLFGAWQTLRLIMEDFFIVFPATVRFLWVVASIILPIILFFKIWGMTNDIKKIEKIVNDFNNHYCSTNDIYKQYSRKYTPLELRRFLLLGDKETYKAAVISNFIANIEYGELSGFDDDEMKNISIGEF